uniref:Inactive tyrosine-protein kinase PEAK1 n=1 Tax=Latimeria chalumnae TaxID=7897 RepID=H3A1A1_LATCH
MSACNTFTEHVWKPGECKNCFKPKSLHRLPQASEKASVPCSNLKTNANHSNNHRVRSSTSSFRPPVAKKPTIAVKPTMIVVDGQGMCGEISMSEHCENKQMFVGWNRNGVVLNKKPLNNNNNEEEMVGYSHVHRSCSIDEGGNKIPNNNNNGLTDVLKEIAGLDTTSSIMGSEPNTRESFFGRINNCYKRSLERKIPPSCITVGMRDSQNKHVVLSGSTEIISSEGGRFCYPEFSSGDESDDDFYYGKMHEEHESWDESDEELLAMEIRMRGQPRFANFRANTLSPVRFCTSKKWNTVPLRNKSLQRICAVDYDDSYDEILNGYGEETVIPYGQESMQSMVSSDSTSPDSSMTEESQSGTASSVSQKLCNGSTSPDSPNKMKCIETDYESLGDSQQGGKANWSTVNAAKSPVRSPETHKAVLALRLQEKDGRIAVQNEKEDSPKISKELPGQPVTTINLVPVEEQAKPYRVVNLEKPGMCKPYTVVDVSAAMTSECLENRNEASKSKGSMSTPNSPGTPGSPIGPGSPTTPPGQLNTSRKKSSAIRYQEVWTSSTSPRQKMPKVELISGTSGPAVLPRKSSHKSAPTSPTTTNVSSKTIPVKSPNLSEIKFNSYNNAGMPPFPIIIHDEPTYAKSSKNAVKVPIVINPNAYDNLAIYRSFLGTSGELSNKEKTTSIISHTYEEIGVSESKPHENAPSKATELPRSKVTTSSSEPKLGTVAQKVQEFNNSLNKGPSSPQKNFSSSHSSPARTQRSIQDTLTKREGTQEPLSPVGNRENASTVLSQIVASIQPPQSPPEAPQASAKTCSAEELYSTPLDADGSKEIPVRPKSLHTSSQVISGTEPSKSADSNTSKTRKDTLPKQVANQTSKVVTAQHSNPSSPKSEQTPPFPPPRSTSSPYHASNLLQRHFSNWTKPTSPTRTTEAESIFSSESRRAPDAKPKRWISFKSFFRRRKTDEEEEKEKDREKGKLVGLDGTVIHMLPPPPIQRHHWFSESKTTAPNEKPSIIFTYKQESVPAELGPEQSKSSAEQPARASGATDTAEKEKSSPEKTDPKKESPSSPPPLPQKIIKHPTYSAAENFEAPVVQKAASAKGTNTSGLLARPALTAEVPLSQEEKDEASDSADSSPCSATYSNLGQSRANMIPPKQPRQPKGASDDAIAFGEAGEQEAAQESQPTPPPLPKKTIVRANTEPTPKEASLRQNEIKPIGSNLSVINPLYDIEANWDAASACSSVSSDPKIIDHESGDSLDRALGKSRINGSVANSVASLTSIRDKTSNSLESLSGRHNFPGRQGRGIQKPQRQALYKGIENREEVVGKIRNLHADSLKKLAVKCEDRFMAGQKDQLQFGVDSWSDFRLTSDKPCCEAGDAVYYTASYAKDPLNNYAVKICKSKAKESQQQYYHSLAVRQSLAVHFNIQQDCGHFLADVPIRLLPWEDPNSPVIEEEEEEEGGGKVEEKKRDRPLDSSRKNSSSSQGTVGKHRSRVVVITREVPYQTVADFVRESIPRHERNPDLYERQVCLLLLQLCAGLEHLKPYHVTHCDLRLENLLLAHSRPANQLSLEPLEPNHTIACPARLIISNFSQAKQKSHVVDPEVLRDQSRLAPEIITATQYKKCDEFQTGILIYEMLHLPNPFEENPELKEKEYTQIDLPLIPQRSLYSHGLQQLANFLLNPNPSERILISDAKGILQCLLWGPREDLFHMINSSSSLAQRDAVFQNWLDLKRTLLMIKFAEKSMEGECWVTLEDWLCCQYLAFANTDSLSRIVKIIQQQ